MQIQTDLNLKEPKAAINISQEGVVKAMGERDFKIVRSWFKNCEIADIAETFEDLDMPLQMALFRLVPKVRRASLFSYFNFDLQEEFLEELPEVVVTSVVNDMEPDDRTRLLEELPRNSKPNNA